MKEVLEIVKAIHVNTELSDEKQDAKKESDE